MRIWPAWGADHPVFNAIQRGSGWFYAWHSQACTPWPAIARKTGITLDRLAELDRGQPPVDVELDKLSELWRCDPADVRRSIENGVAEPNYSQKSG